jgi:protease-4
MHLSTLIQILNRPWLMEPTQATVWEGIVNQVLYQGASFNALVPGRNPLDWEQDNTYKNRASYRSLWRANANGDMDPKGPVLVIDVMGPVMKTDYCGSAGMQSMAQAIGAANADDSIAAIMLRIDSPGGTVDGTHNLARTIAASPKVSVAYVDGMMCSASYWLGSAAREIIATDANAGHLATIGSIGTMAQYVDMTQANAQRGIKVETIYATRSKRKGQYGRDLRDGKYERVVAELDALNETFISSVEQYRAGKLKPTPDNDVFEGDTYNAREAIKLGLIDRIGTFNYAVKRALQIAKTITK